MLVAAIETLVRLGLDLEPFEKLLEAMRSDTSLNIYKERSQSECMRVFYKHGGTFFAAASLMCLQEFLDPAALYALLRVSDDCVDDADDHVGHMEMDAAKPEAKDLGRAFQLTNFSRNIDEDIDIQRLYVPVELCEKHCMDLPLRHATRRSSAP